MKKTIIILYLFTVFQLGAQTPANDPHWQLVFEDSFDTLNTDKWKVLNWAIHGKEPQLYLASNINVANNKLVISVDSHNVKCDPYNQIAWAACDTCITNKIYNYTSGWLETNESFQYGYIESRIKMPYGYGFWPAFWTWKKGADNAAEIDIFEMLGHLGSTTVMPTNVHLAYCDTNYAQYECDTLYKTICYDKYGDEIYCYDQHVEIPPYTDWHTYAVEWSPTKIIWYVDDIMVRNFPNPGVIGPVRIILNFAIHPTFLPNETTPFPEEMLVDYVRVWQLNKSCDDYINATNYDFNTYDNSVKNFIKIGAGGGDNSLSVGDDVTIRASQFIEINGEFTVPLGASFFAITNDDCSNNLDTNCTQTFNPTSYDFSSYDNSVKKEIILRPEGSDMSIIPTNKNILLHATDAINISPDVQIKQANGYSVEVKRVECPDDKK